MAIKIEQVAQVLRSNQIPTEKIRAIVEVLQTQEDNKKSEKEPGAKKQYIILNSGESAGYVLQIEENEDAGTTIEKIKTAARLYNNSRKGSKTPSRSITETLSLPRKFLVDSGLWIKTKEPVRALNIDNNTL